MVPDEAYLWHNESCDQVWEDQQHSNMIIRCFYPVEPNENEGRVDAEEGSKTEDQLMEICSSDDIDWNNNQNGSGNENYVSNNEMILPKSSSSDLMEFPKERKKSTRKPSLRPEYMNGLRVLRSDIRRKYPEMYTNVMNSLDGKLISQFFQKFCSNNIIYECIKKEQCEIGKFAAALVPKPVVGISSLIPFMVTFFTPTIFADMVLRLKSSKVIVTQGVPGSRIVAQDHSEMTMLYSVERIPYPDHLSLPSPSSPSPSFDILDPVSNDLIRFSLLPTPIRVKLEIDLVLTLDEAHLINGIYTTQRNSVIMPIDD